MEKPSFQMSADARFIYQHLKTIRIGVTCRFEDLSAVIGRDVRGATPALQTAIRACLREDSIVFGSVRGVGYKRLSDAEIVDAGQSTLDHIRRASRRGVVRMMAVDDFDALPDDKKLQHSARLSVLATLAEAASSKQLTKVERAIGDQNKQLPVADTLKLFAS